MARTGDFSRKTRQAAIQRQGGVRALGITFVRPPKEAPYGTVAVFQDLYGNLWDLVETKEPKNGS